VRVFLKADEELSASLAKSFNVVLVNDNIVIFLTQGVRALGD
jgi:hypothetical protein